MGTNEKIDEARQADKDIMLSALNILRDLHDRKKVVLLLQITDCGEKRLAEMKTNGTEPDREKVLERVRFLLTNAFALVVADGMKEVIELVGEPALSIELDMREPHDVHGESATVH